MKKYILLFLSLFFTLLIPNVVSANVDQTNAFGFTYKCEDGEGILEADFNQGGHHHYYRTYKINIPGVISISDENHTTIAESTGISIGGCNYEPKECKISSYGNWEYDDRVEDILRIGEGNSNSKIKKISSIVFEVENTSSKITTGTGDNQKTEYNSDLIFILNDSEKNMGKKVSSIRIELTSKGFEINGKLIDGLKRTSGIADEYYFVQESDKIILKQKIYKREGIGVGSSGTENRTFSAISGGYEEVGGTRQPCASPNSIDRNYKDGYCTGLDFWDYTQHYYTTTKVVVHPVSFSCRRIEYNDGTSDLEYDFDGTLDNIEASKFEGPIVINGQKEDSGLTIESTNTLDISGLRQTAIAKVGEENLYVNRIEITIKENNLTLGKADYGLSEEMKDVGTFKGKKGIKLIPIDSNWSVNNGLKSVITEKVGNYQIVFTFFTGEGQQLGTYATPLVIIPNNDFKLGLLEKTTSGDKYTDGLETITMCQSFTDSYGNLITRKNDILNNSYVSSQDPYTIISNVKITTDSRLCFDVARLAPGLPGVIDIYIPQHNLDVDLTPNNNKVHFALDFGTTNTITGESFNYNNSNCNGNNCSMTNCPAIPPVSTITKPATSAEINEACKISGFFYYDKNGDDNNRKNSNETEFKSPFSLKLEIKSGSDEWNGQPLIGIDQLYRLTLLKNAEVNISNGILNSISEEKIHTYSSGTTVNGHIWGKFTTVNSNPTINNANFNLNKWTFTGAINVNRDENVLLAPVVKANEILISYSIAGKNVQYLLPEVKIEGCERDTLGVKVLGTLQADGQANITGQEDNFSDLSTSEMRGIIKKNATELTRGMKDGDVVNGLKYVEGRSIILPDTDFSKYDTIVVKNGNVLINGDITSLKGIIVLKDNYNIRNDYQTTGNVYVANNVENINAVIYADGALISSSSTTHSPYNYEELTKPLKIKGSLFTRNTIGGSIEGTLGKILLPGGGQATTDTDKILAGYYDLNNIRMWGSSCAEDAPFPLTIEYDSRIQTNPPKGFNN